MYEVLPKFHINRVRIKLKCEVNRNSVLNWQATSMPRILDFVFFLVNQLVKSSYTYEYYPTF